VCSSDLEYETKVMPMRFRKQFVLVVAPLALALTGCFQQAGTALQEPIDNQAVSVPATSIPLPTDDGSGAGGTNNTGDQGQVLNTPTFESQPDNSSTTGNTDTTNPPVALTIISATIPPLATETPGSDSSDATSGQATDVQQTPAGGQFITPSGPLGPVTQAPISVATSDGGTGQTAATPSGLVTPTAFAPIDAAGSCTHTVAPGDTLYRISVKYGISVTQLKQANPQVTSDIIQPGDVLKIPNCDATGNTGSTVTQPTAEPNVPATALPSGSQTYVVKRGDTLYTIGLKFGVSAKAIQEANNISNPDRISPGQELVIPAKSR